MLVYLRGNGLHGYPHAIIKLSLDLIAPRGKFHFWLVFPDSVSEYRDESPFDAQ